MEQTQAVERAARAMELRRATTLVANTLDDVLVALTRGDFEAGRMYLQGIAKELTALSALTLGEVSEQRAVHAAEIVELLNLHRRYARRLGVRA